MIAFDTDILTDIFEYRDPYVSRAKQIPLADQSVPIVVLEEVLRGRFDYVRKAEAAKGQPVLVRAYELLQQSVESLSRMQVLPYTLVSHSLVLTWRLAKIRVKPMDMRIAAIAIANNATLATRNARDFKLVPGLKLDVWT